MSCTGCSITISEFITKIENKNEMLKFLFEHGVVPEVIKCPYCNVDCKLYTNRYRFVCTKSVTKLKGRKKVRGRCIFETSLKKNTFFSKSKLSMETICKFVALRIGFQLKQVSLEQELKISSSTVVDWTNFCREVCLLAVLENSEKLGGKGKIVEIDEAKFGSRKYSRGRVIEGQWIFGGIERESKKTFLVPVPNGSQETLLEVINEWILPSTTIMSDCWRAYDCLENEGFTHQRVNHSKNFVDPDKTANKNVREGFPTYGRREEHYALYIAEFYFHRKFPELSNKIHNFFSYVSEVCPPTNNEREEQQ